ncbi:hypothetical protein IU487_32880 [Nocardia puris]|uniref:hypothetical protein n=1 Tax=Nocardia puris TaxID=208602 RepID=UPI00189540ED|nr:hypothetical protein [Nocardia puris]MBF6215795.1 hypothetical protein [Nocardia puris]
MTHQILSAVDIIGINDHQPTRALWTALGKIATWPSAPSRTHADLTIYPVHRDEATSDRWYELWWTHPSAVVETDYSIDGGSEFVAVEPVRIEAVQVLPAPPVIPVEQRLAELEPLGPVTVTEADRRFFGENAEAQKRDWLESNRRVAVRGDGSTAIYDWAAYAAQVAEILAAQPARSLTPGQRAAAALARLDRARDMVINARASVVGMIGNAVAAADLDPLGQIARVVELLDPTLAGETEVRKAIDATTNPAAPRRMGRPPVGSTISVAYPADLLARIDAAAAASGLSRAAWLRHAAEAAAVQAEYRARD